MVSLLLLYFPLTSLNSPYIDKMPKRGGAIGWRTLFDLT